MEQRVVVQYLQRLPQLEEVMEQHLHSLRALVEAAAVAPVEILLVALEVAELLVKATVVVVAGPQVMLERQEGVAEQVALAAQRPLATRPMAALVYSVQ
jgi:hypothetical protein